MRNKILIAVFALVLCPAVVDAAKPINNLKNQTVPIRLDGSQYSLEQIQTAIIEACAARGWQPIVDKEGEISATINVRGKHYAKISIPFTATSYSILYVDSNNLDYNAKKQKIHRNYNNWVVKLSGTIDKQISSGPSPITALPKEPENPTTIENDQLDFYGDLLKLSELRDRGLLTEDEFEEEKQKLLQQD